MSGSRDDREFEELLRAALHERAGQVVPSGDGLQRIQARTSGRRRFRWFKPAVVAMTAAAAATAVAVLPNVIKSADNAERPASQATLSHTTAETTTGPESTPTSPKATDRMTLASKPLAWPYPDEETAREEGASASKALLNPSEAAKEFVRTAVASDDWKAGDPQDQNDSVQVPIYRGKIEVTTVTLAPVESNGRTIYVVERAVSPRLQITQVPDLQRFANPVAKGTVDSDGGHTTVALKDVRTSETLDFTGVPRSDQKVWEATFNEQPPVDSAVVAWTKFKNGVTAIAAAPTRR